MALAPPELEYLPNFEAFKARRDSRLESTTFDNSLPAGFPKHLNSSLVWQPQDLENEMEDWIHHFSETEIEEIDAALRSFQASGLPPGQSSPETFPLPTLHTRLRRCSDQIHGRRGIALLRGFPVDKYSREENILVYVGISSHIAIQRGRQDRQYKDEKADVVISHITDLRSIAGNGTIGAPAYTNDMQAFHNDSGDIVSLFSLSEAAEGGESQLVSSWWLYNELARSRPEYLRTLAEDWVVNRKKPETPFIRRPLLYHQPATANSPERVILQCSRSAFTTFGGLGRPPNIPPITEEQAEILDGIHFLAADHAFTLSMQKGDMQFINDFSIMHARTAYTDDEHHSRHLIRLWLRDPENAWQTPESLQTRWNGCYGGVTPESQVFPLEPYVRTLMKASAI